MQKIKYKNIDINYGILTESVEVYAKSKVSSHHGENLKEMIDKCKKDIDNWLENSAVSYEELAQRIEKYCVAELDYYGVEIDREMLEKEVKGFIKNNT